MAEFRERTLTRADAPYRVLVTADDGRRLAEEEYRSASRALEVASQWSRQSRDRVEVLTSGGLPVGWSDHCPWPVAILSEVAGSPTA